MVTAAFTKEALRKAMGPLDAILGRSSEARAGTTEVRGGLRSLQGGMEYDLALRREGLARGRSMRAQTVRIGAHFERSKRMIAAGDLGQDPGEMVIAGVPPVLTVVPALLAGGSMESGGASLILICEGNAEVVVKKMGELGEATHTSEDAGGWMALRMTRMGSQSGAWMMRMRRWVLSMLLEPSCL